MTATAFSHRVLIVDDDRGVRDLLGEFLAAHGFEVRTAGGGREADAALADDDVDVVILDVMMPGEDGLSICRRLRRAGGPAIVMLSAMGDETDRIVGLELGADDYVAKPCNPRELLARVRAQVRRRVEADERSGARHQPYAFAGYMLDPRRRQVRTPSGVLVELSSGECALLRALLDRPHEVQSREALARHVFGAADAVNERTIDVQISRLRRRLEDFGAQGQLIGTVRNVGYLINSPVTRL